MRNHEILQRISCDIWHFLEYQSYTVSSFIGLCFGFKKYFHPQSVYCQLDMADRKINSSDTPGARHSSISLSDEDDTAPGTNNIPNQTEAPEYEHEISSAF